MGNPIRPVVNNINAPNYKLAKFLTKNLKAYIQLPYQYNVKNSTNLAHYLEQLKIHEKHKLITFDIKDLYVNIPIDETISITQTLLLIQNNKTSTQQMIKLTETILQQNYFIFADNIYQPEKGISMGSPLSSDIAEIFLQHLEQTYLKH
jgi:hypothetical protein